MTLAQVKYFIFSFLSIGSVIFKQNQQIIDDDGSKSSTMSANKGQEDDESAEKKVGRMHRAILLSKISRLISPKTNKISLAEIELRKWQQR